MRAAILRWAKRRAPDFVIGGQDDPYLLRWFLIPRNPVFNIYVHQFLRSDDDRALHDHPWLFNCSILLEGSYREWFDVLRRHIHGRYWIMRESADRTAGDVKFRWGAAPHRVELHQDPFSETHHSLPCWTVFITGPRVREWGFHCPQGWVHWKKFTDSRDSGAVGKGCDQ